MNIEEMKQLFIELEDHLRKYGNNSILSSYKLVRSTIKFLESNESDEDKKDIIIYSYKMLYSEKGGLSEFCIWDNDYDKRVTLNEPLERIHSELWESVKEYL